jgi:hypothetical protein
MKLQVVCWPGWPHHHGQPHTVYTMYYSDHVAQNTDILPCHAVYNPYIYLYLM